MRASQPWPWTLSRVIDIPGFKENFFLQNFNFILSCVFYPSVSTCLPTGSYQESFPPFQGESVIINSIITVYICSSNDCKIKLGDLQKGFPGDSNGKHSAYNAGDPDSVPGWGRSRGEGNDNPLQYSCLENSMDRGA